jgi:hypothetical protein
MERLAEFRPGKDSGMLSTVFFAFLGSIARTE